MKTFKNGEILEQKYLATNEEFNKAHRIKFAHFNWWNENLKYLPDETGSAYILIYCSLDLLFTKHR